MVDRVKNMIDIVRVIGARIPLDHQNMAHCPFHDDTKPSFSVSAKGQYFHCFGCGISGDVIRFLELYEHKSFLQALRESARLAGVEMPELSREEQAVWDHQRSIEDVLQKTTRFYESKLSQDAVKYLEDRGLTAETVKQFRIGFAPGGLRDHLLNKCGFPEELCIEAGVLKKTLDGSSRDYFHERIMFPFIRHGQVVFLTGRAIDDAEPKYLNLARPIEAIFNEEALHKNDVILTEGVFDSLSLVQEGFNAVALHGVNLKPEYAQRLSECDRVYICLDGDDAGRKGAMKIGALLGEKSRIVELPEGQDPHDYLRCHAGTEFAELLKAAKTPLTLELESIPADTPKTELAGRLIPFLQRLAQLDKPTAEAWISDKMKARFELNSRDLEAYRSMMKERHSDSDESSDSGDDNNEATPCAIFPGLVDVVEHNGQPAFLVKEGEELKILETVEVDGEVCKPPARESIPWLLARGEKVIEHYERNRKLGAEADAVLFDDLVKYHEGVSELPDKGFYCFLAAWDLHTYVLEQTRYSPIICLFSVPVRGKSRTGQGMIYVARRGVYVESLRDAYLVRIAQDWQAAVFFDVRDIWGRAEKSGSEDILLHRFEKGARVPRVLYPDRGPYKDIVYYSIFGPTIVATNEGANDILETRAITITMPESNRCFENDVTQESALEFKERLLAFRARYMGKELPEVAKPAPGRLGDILKPLRQVILLARPDQEGIFLEMVKKLQIERLIDKGTSLEAQLLQIIRQSDQLVQNGILPVKAITEAFNSGKSPKEEITTHRVGRKLRAMGFDKAKTATGASAIRWDKAQIERMSASYGLGQTSEISGSSETPGEPGEWETHKEPEAPEKKEEENLRTENTDATDRVVVYKELNLFEEAKHQEFQKWLES